MNKYLKRYGLRLLIVVLIAALIVGLATRSRSDGSAGPLMSAANSLRIPVQGAVGSVVDWLRGIYGYIYQYDKLVAENESLRQQLAEAQDQVRQSAEAAEENVRLRTLLGYLEKNTTFITESAMITSWGAVRRAVPGDLYPGRPVGYHAAELEGPHAAHRYPRAQGRRGGLRGDRQPGKAGGIRGGLYGRGAQRAGG